MSDDLKNLKVGDVRTPTEDIYDAVREHIEDEKYLKRFDKIMGNLETEQDVEDFFEEVILEYLNEEVAPEGFGFAIHKDTGEIGFWEFNEETEEFDLPYDGMVYVNPDKDEDEEDILPEDDLDEENKDPKKKEKVAELLDERGEVVARTSYREGAPETDPGSVEESGTKAEVA
jgi:hypothetical protein